MDMLTVPIHNFQINLVSIIEKIRTFYSLKNCTIILDQISRRKYSHICDPIILRSSINHIRLKYHLTWNPYKIIRALGIGVQYESSEMKK